MQLLHQYDHQYDLFGSRSASVYVSKLHAGHFPVQIVLHID